MSRWLTVRRAVAIALALILVGVAVAWTHRESLLAWYLVRGLAMAGDGDRNAWADRVYRLDRSAVPRLIACLGEPDARPCGNAQLCLARLLKHWGDADERSWALAEALAANFPGFSPCGQVASLQLIRLLGHLGDATAAPEPLLRATAEILKRAAEINRTELHAAALAVAQSRLGQTPAKEMALACRQLVQCCLRDEVEAHRVQALHLAVQPGIDLRDTIVPLLHDPSPDIRRAAMLEVGPAKELITTDELLKWLHDPDAEVQRLCEAALRGRGLRDEHIKLARLISDKRPSIRLQVLRHLHHNPELEPGVWLRRLSHDPSAAVRAASVRVAAGQSSVDLSDRIEQMAQSDPSPTVRQLAQFYRTRKEAE